MGEPSPADFIPIPDHDPTTPTKSQEAMSRVPSSTKSDASPFSEPDKPTTQNPGELPPTKSGEAVPLSSHKPPRRPTKAPRRYPDPERRDAFDLPDTQWANSTTTTRYLLSNRHHSSIYAENLTTLDINHSPRAMAMHINSIE
ncbi:hypothetical protein ACA910_011491 [Epithemia clementina (nom. ined.)]